MEEITIDHIPASIASGGLLGLESAPHQVEAWAVFDRSVFKVDDIDADFYEADSNRRLDDKVFERGKVKAILLGSFQYDIHHDQHIQTFSVSNWAKSRMIKYKLAVRDVVIRFKNNWGNPNYTCIYRVRIHGK